MNFFSVKHLNAGYGRQPVTHHDLPRQPDTVRLGLEALGAMQAAVCSAPATSPCCVRKRRQPWFCPMK